MNKEILIEALSLIPGGKQAVAEKHGLSYEAVRKWTKNGLPRTEWTGETSYAETIAAMQNKYSKDDLLGRSETEAA